MSLQGYNVGDVVTVPSGYGAHSGMLGRVDYIGIGWVTVVVVMMVDPRVEDRVSVRAEDLGA